MSCLIRHQARKTPCNTILETKDLPNEFLEDPNLTKKKCRFCGRVFSSYNSMRNHVRNTCKIAPNKQNHGEGMEKLYKHTLQKQASAAAAIQRQADEIAALKLQNKMLGDRQEEIMSMVSKIASSDVATIQIGGDCSVVQVDNRKQVTIINIFGQEGVGHATVSQIKTILDESIKTPAVSTAVQDAILKTAMLVYSDPSRPENLTCYLPNKKTNDVLVHAELGWEVQPASLVLPPMARKSVDTLFELQPYENAKDYGPLMLELANNEYRYIAGTELRPILVRNKDLLMRALEALPAAGSG